MSNHKTGEEHHLYKKLSAEDMTVNNLTVFMLALREGMGLGHACMITHNEPKTICRYIKDVETFNAQCRQAVDAANMDLLKASSELMDTGKWEKAEETRAKAERIHKLVQWEEYGTVDDLQEQLLVDVMELHNPKDIAIGFGLSFRQYLDYLNRNPELLEVVEQYKKVINGK